MIHKYISLSVWIHPIRKHARYDYWDTHTAWEGWIRRLTEDGAAPTWSTLLNATTGEKCDGTSST